MLRSMEVHLHKDPYVPNLVIGLLGASQNAPLFVKNITGLEPVNAVVNSRGYGQQDGEFFTSTNIGKRNIVITFGLNTKRGGVSVSEARALLYGYCMPKMLLKLRFISDDRVPVEIEAFVETWTPNRFSQDPEIQISFICPKPHFVSLERKQASGSARQDPPETEVVYQGNVTTGIHLALTMSPAYSGGVVIEHRMLGSGPMYRKVELEMADYPTDGYLWMNSLQGEKVLRAYEEPPDPDWDNLLDKMTNESLWTFLAPGVNLIRVRTVHSNLYRTWGLAYYEKFGAI